MADEHVEFQSATPATPPAGTQVAVDLVAGVAYQKIKLDGGGDGLLVPIEAGRRPDAASLPVALSTEDVALIDGLETSLGNIKTATEALAALVSGGALKTDDDATQALLATQAGYLDGLETLVGATNTAIGLLTALISAGVLKVDDDGTQALLSTIDGHVDGLEALVTTTNSSLSTIDGHVDGIETLIAATNTALGLITALISGGALKVDDDATQTALGLITALISGGALKVDDDATQTLLTTIDGHVDQVEGYLATLAGIVGSSKAAVKAGAGDLVDLATIAAAISGARMLVTGNVRASWTDGTQVVAITTLAKGAISRTTFAVPTKLGAYLYVWMGRTGATALDKAVHVRLRRIVNGVTNLAPEAAFDSDIAAAVSGVCAGSGNNAGVTSLTLNAAKTYAVGTNNEIWLAIIDNTTTPTTVSEWVRQSVATSTTVKLLDAPTISAHNNTAHNVADKANVFKMFVEGGCTYELIIDYGEATTGDPYVIAANLQTLDALAVAA